MLLVSVASYNLGIKFLPIADEISDIPSEQELGRGKQKVKRRKLTTKDLSSDQGTSNDSLLPRSQPPHHLFKEWSVLSSELWLYAFIVIVAVALRLFFSYMIMWCRLCIADRKSVSPLHEKFCTWGKKAYFNVCPPVPACRRKPASKTDCCWSCASRRAARQSQDKRSSLEDIVHAFM